MKVPFFCLLVLCTFFFNSLFDNLIDPVIDSIVAVKQVEDSEEAAATMRGYSSLSNVVPVITWVGTFAIGVAMFGRNIINSMRGFE